MKTVRRLFYVDIVTAVAFVSLAFLSLFYFIDSWHNQSGTMMLGFPEWIVYAVMTPALALTTVIAVWQAVAGVQSTSEHQA